MDLPTAAAAPIVRTIGGKQIEFHPLPMRERAVLIAHWRESDRQDLLNDLADSKVEPEMRLKALREWTARKMTVHEVIEWIWSPEGSRQVLAKASDLQLDRESLPLEEQVILASDLFGFHSAVDDAGASDSPPAEDTPGPDPTTDSTSGTGS